MKKLFLIGLSAFLLLVAALTGKHQVQNQFFPQPSSLKK